jgi:UDP-glucose 4-epimerase
MKILITGGAGFIGSHLADHLLGAGHTVAVVDNLSTGSEENISQLMSNPRFSFVYDTILNTTLMTMLIEQADVVYHLAAAVGVQLIADRPVHTIETNIHGTEVVLEIANKFRRRVLLASTSEVYGKSEAVPFKEDDDTVLGSTRFSRWAYACSKAVDEFLGLAYFNEFGLEVIVARLFNTIGPRQTGRYGMVVPRFVEQALKNESIIVYGSGKQSRCFSYVGDVVEGIVSLMDCKESVGRVYNIGSTEEITIERLADRIIALTGSKSTKKFISYEEAYGKPFDDMMRRVPCTERIRQTTGWQSRTSLDEMLKTIIADKRSQMNI